MSAAPHVAGVCALVWARFPQLDYHGVIKPVLAGTEPNATLAGKCLTGGRLNLHRALTPLAPSLQFQSLANGQFRLRLFGEPNETYVIQSSTNLVQWRSIFTNTVSSQGFFDFSEPRTLKRRFYRAFH